MSGLSMVSFFSGIGGFDLGFERAGFRVLAHSDVKPFANAILATHWPDRPNLGDLNAICPAGTGEHDCAIPRATVWTGGFPCSDLSLLGKRAGLVTGDRSSLGLVFLDLVGRHRPDWVVLENVPGLLSARSGRDIGMLLGILADLGYWWAYRLLDATDFGLVQIRRRVLVVASTRTDGASAVLHRSLDGGVPSAAQRRAAAAAASGRQSGAGDRGEPSAAGGPDERPEPWVVASYSGGSVAQISTWRDGHVPALIPRFVPFIIDDQPEPWAVNSYFAGPGTQLQHNRDGFVYTLTPSNGPGYVVLGDAAANAEDDADGVRAHPGLPGRVDGADAGSGGDVRPSRLDNARWHVLGRALPPVIAEWIADGIREVEG